MKKWLFSFLLGFGGPTLAEPQQIHLWHQMIYSHREILAQLIREFEQTNPDIKIKAIFRETEELRSAFQSAAMAGTGPELIFGPSDQVGPFVAMNLLAPLDEDFSPEETEQLHSLAVVRENNHIYALGDSIGNHLMLLYNRKLVSQVPKTMQELEELALRFAPAKGYGLVFNFNEPFFIQPWIHSFGSGFMENNQPNLNTPAVAQTLRWVLNLREKKIIPRECDYEMANALFKTGQAAFIVNGDWSWGDYKNAKLDFGIAPLPKNADTGLYPQPLVSTRGYSLNRSIKSPWHREAALKFVRFMLSSESQKKFSQAAGIFPSRLDLKDDPDLQQQPLFKENQQILTTGYPMPIVPEIRAVWDSLRSQLQSTLAGSVTPEEAAALAQSQAEDQIRTMNSVEKPNGSALVVKVLLGALVLLSLWFFYRLSVSTWQQLHSAQSFMTLMIFPAFLIVFAVIVYPFVYNFLISVSNFSLRSFQDWEIIGFSHYVKLLSQVNFYVLLGKTLIWTVANVFFHVVIGVTLALAIDQVLPAKPLWRAILIIPWAVPQYITALTWRGMFHQEFGPINAFLTDFLHQDPVAWLTQPFTAFAACVITNVWLGFPFMMVVALGGLQSIPRDLYEAAKLDGANALSRFRHITWPLLQPVLRPAIGLGALWTFNALNVVWLVSNAGEPANQTHILITAIYKSAFSMYQYGAAAAGSLVIFILLLLTALLITKMKKEGTT